MDQDDNRYLIRHRHSEMLRLPPKGDVEYYRGECAALAGKVALLSRENEALRANNAWQAARIVELELLNAPRSTE